MFDLGFSELLLIALVALIVLGPQRLPKAARFAGLWVRRARAQWHSVKSEFERELADEELRRTLQDTRAQFEDTAGTLREGLERTGDAWRRETENLARAATAGAPLARDPLPPEAAVPQIEPAPGAELPHDDEDLHAELMNRRPITSEPPDDDEFDREPEPEAATAVTDAAADDDAQVQDDAPVVEDAPQRSLFDDEPDTPSTDDDARRR